MSAGLAQRRLPDLADCGRGGGRSAAAARGARRAGLREGGRPQHRHRRDDAVRRLCRLRHRLRHELALARLPRGRGGGPRDGDADGALLRPPWAQPDRDRDRPHPRRGRDHRPPPPRAIQPHLSAIATGRDPGHSRAERDPDHRAQPLLPAPDGLHRGHSGRGARPAFPQHQRGAQPPGRRRQARRARRGRDQRDRDSHVVGALHGRHGGDGRRLHGDDRSRNLRALHDRRRRLHRHRAGHAGTGAGRSGC